MNNYRVDIFEEVNGEQLHTMQELPEFWLAKALSLQLAENPDRYPGVKSVYILERMSDGAFDVTRKVK